MKKQIYLLATLLFITLTTNAQLSIGDIAFIGYNSDGGIGTNDNFTFITLTDIPGGYLIEYGYDSAETSYHVLTTGGSGGGTRSSRRISRRTDRAPRCTRAVVPLSR